MPLFPCLLCFSVCLMGNTGAPLRGIVPMFLPTKDVAAFCDSLLSSDSDLVDPQAQWPGFRFKSPRVLPFVSVSPVFCVILVCPVGKTGTPQCGIVPMFLPPKDVVAFCDSLLSSDSDLVDLQVQPQLPSRLPGPGPFFCLCCL